MAEEDPRLPAKAEALLQGLPLREPDFEALAARIDAQLAAVAPGSTDDALLAAPFPDEPGEELPSPAEPVAPRLSDLARAVAQKRTDAADTELAREALSAASQLRSQTDVLLERMRAAPKAAEPPLRPVATEAVPARPVPPPPSLPRAGETAPAASASPPALGAKDKKGSLTALWGGAGLVLAAAAAWVVLVGSPQKPDASRAEPAVAAAPAASAVANAESPPGQAPPPVALSEPNPAPAAEAASEPLADARKERASRGAGDEGAVASAPLAARAKKNSSRPEKVELAEAPAAPAPRAQAAAGASKSDAELKPAAGKTDDGLMPDKPSTGAVQAAIASVMGAARACVAGADAATPATVIFGSNGSVKSVVVSGAVDGTPAGKCVSSALSRAKVAPFAQGSFSVGVSVRP